MKDSVIITDGAVAKYTTTKIWMESNERKHKKRWRRRLGNVLSFIGQISEIMTVSPLIIISYNASVNHWKVHYTVRLNDSSFWCTTTDSWFIEEKIVYFELNYSHEHFAHNGTTENDKLN